MSISGGDALEHEGAIHQHYTHSFPKLNSEGLPLNSQKSQENEREEHRCALFWTEQLLYHTHMVGVLEGFTSRTTKITFQTCHSTLRRESPPLKLYNASERACLLRLAKMIMTVGTAAKQCAALETLPEVHYVFQL